MLAFFPSRLGQTRTYNDWRRPERALRVKRSKVTVTFADLVGSTALSARMDPEDLREVISAYRKCVAGTVGRFGACPL